MCFRFADADLIGAVSARVPAVSEGQMIMDAVGAAGFSQIGLSRQGRPVMGRLFEPTVGDSVPSVDGASEPKPALLLVGGIHGDEPASVEALMELVARLSSSELCLQDRTVMILPALNPDGLVLGRKNAASDVDLNRNFPARNFTREHAPGYDPGPSPLSEPEAALLARVVEKQCIGAVVAVHAPFACVNFDGPASAWAQAVSGACGWPVRANLGYPTPGSLGSWLGVDMNLPVLTLELPPGPLGAFRGSAVAALNRACTCPDDIIWSRDGARDPA